MLKVEKIADYYKFRVGDRVWIITGILNPMAVWCRIIDIIEDGYFVSDPTGVFNEVFRTRAEAEEMLFCLQENGECAVNEDIYPLTLNGYLSFFGQGESRKQHLVDWFSVQDLLGDDYATVYSIQD